MSPTGPNKFQRGITPKRIYERIQKSDLFCIIDTNSYTKFDVNILIDDREKCRKLYLNKRKYILQLGQI